MSLPRLTRLAACAVALVASLFAEETPKKVGIIGLDTSHVVAFTTVLNKGPKNPADAAKFAGFRVTHAYAQGSKDIPESTSRVPEYAEKLKGMGVEIVGSIEQLCAQVDCVLLESNDGRVHLEQLLPVLKSGKPVFIDKPIAGSLADVIRIQDAAKQAGTLYFCSSSLRFAAGTQAVGQGSIGKVKTAHTTSPASLEPHHPDLFWYGIHAMEALYTVMGRGCQTIVRTHTPTADVVTGVWSDGRVGTMRGNIWGLMSSVSSTLVDHSCLPSDMWSAKPVTAAFDESVACTAKLLNTAATQVSTVPARAWGERAASTLAVSHVSLVAVWLGANTRPCSPRNCCSPRNST